MKSINTTKLVCGILGSLALSASAVAGTYANITIDGDFSDWVGVPILTSDTTGDGDPVDFFTLYAANDENNLYLRVVYNNPVGVNGANAQVFIALDNDNNTATGFDVYGLGLIGSEVGWQNDFPFEQTTGNFNTGNGITDGGASIALYNTTVSEQEISISRSATFTIGGATIFPNDTFAIAMYSNGTTLDDFIGAGVYTFASVPEPAHYAMIFVGLAGAITLLRRRNRA
ncbi:PEP-CTERM sorting domain-containing protein [Cerasicoccus frondis]|uniref:PEP-CTERM sorting domain-containing protein n=1 Tax=Cerasicoccus frondis TaxID=490090 RepID=UPI002852A5FC|nr:PEP-CTERM sorting domain-containing protein [Cerasicoccus frondis]